MDGWLEFLARDLALEDVCKGVEERPLSDGLALCWDISIKDSVGAPTSNPRLESDSNL